MGSWGCVHHWTLLIGGWRLNLGFMRAREVLNKLSCFSSTNTGICAQNDLYFQRQEQRKPRPLLSAFPLTTPPSHLSIPLKWVTGDTACFPSVPHGGSWLHKWRATFNSNYNRKWWLPPNNCAELTSWLRDSHCPRENKTAKKTDTAEINAGLQRLTMLCKTFGEKERLC